MTLFDREESSRLSSSPRHILRQREMLAKTFVAILLRAMLAPFIVKVLTASG
jgi:hypothetical protein